MSTENIIQIFLTLVLVSITGYYAWQTRKTVGAMETANEENNRPVISLSLKERAESISFIDFVITNAGRGVARDVSFQVKGDNFWIKDIGNKKEYVKDFRVLKNGIKVLAPQERRSYWFLSLMGRMDEIQKASTTIKITYFNNAKSKKYSDEFDLDFMSLPEYSLGADPIYKSSKELEKIRMELERIRKEIKR